MAGISLYGSTAALRIYVYFYIGKVAAFSEAPHNLVHLLKYRISLVMRKPVIIGWINPTVEDKAADWGC